ncbi:helix-turn-helix transcriptional regulator [Anaerocolumna sp. MB42-C2]|uniref:helix-turn-helix transcriptional regulator n=1 Tax=Anaerocolumna sp. MB42-C2 TaxID=3070997 RepID=UPI0027E0C41A|nr:helix-turn-helix transcriptional regulator [Anaerocolumna sp. MB42-C2]WMJ85459.1 helix-turn-helix transcriptional regulator [Anaerocolumna sp. MB42-C2]
MAGMSLKALRVNKGLTQAQAAEKLEISKDTLSNYERGKSFPDVPVIRRIETVYGVGYNDIIFLPKNND